MNKFILLCLPLMILYCTYETIPVPPPVIPPDVEKPDPPVVEVEKYYGLWMNSLFLYNISNTRSPFLSGESIELTLTDNAMIVWNYHEGMRFVIDEYIENTITLHASRDQNLVIKMHIINDSTAECVGCKPDTPITLKKISVLHPTSGNNNYPAYFSDTVFQGKWDLHDFTSGNLSKMMILKKRKVKGFLDYYTYDNISFDFNGDVPQWDIITFRNDSHSLSLIFKFRSDTLLLYEMKPEYRDYGNGISIAVYGKKTECGPLKYLAIRTK